MRADDALKYAAALLQERTEWTTDAIAMCDGDHEPELDAIQSVVSEICQLAAQYGDPGRYSDGRPVRTRAEVQRGLYVEHIWHPDAASEQPIRWRAPLPSDPGVTCPGRYEVSSDPATQTIHVRVVRSV